MFAEVTIGRNEVAAPYNGSGAQRCRQRRRPLRRKYAREIQEVREGFLTAVFTHKLSHATRPHCDLYVPRTEAIGVLQQYHVDRDPSDERIDRTLTGEGTAAEADTRA